MVRLVPELTRAAQAGDRCEVDRLDGLFRPLRDLIRAFGSSRIMYVAAKIVDISDLPPPRPILPLSEAGCGRVARALGALEIDRA